METIDSFAVKDLRQVVWNPVGEIALTTYRRVWNPTPSGVKRRPVSCVSRNNSWKASRRRVGSIIHSVLVSFVCVSIVP